MIGEKKKRRKKRYNRNKYSWKNRQNMRSKKRGPAVLDTTQQCHYQNTPKEIKTPNITLLEGPVKGSGAFGLR